MDEQFDRLARAMAGPLPRRHALRLIAATAAGAGAAMLGVRPASARYHLVKCSCQEVEGSLVCRKTSDGSTCSKSNCVDPAAACTGKNAGDTCC